MMEMIEYGLKHYDDFLMYISQHLIIVLSAFVLSILVALPLGVLAVRHKKIGLLLNTIFNFLFSIPSLAMFAIFIPILGLGKDTAVVVISIYNQVILLRSIVDGFESVDLLIIESARGMGMNSGQIFLKIECPLAAPAICTGIRTSVLSTISMATLAAVINAGGIGRLLFDGIRMTYYVKIYWGAILAALLAFAVSAVLRRVENYAIANANGTRIKKRSNKNVSA